MLTSLIWLDESINTLYGVLSEKYTIKTFHDQNRKMFIPALYLNILESIVRALSDALPPGHRATTNPTLQLHFGCGRATPPVSHSHNWPSERTQHFLFKIVQFFFFFSNKDPESHFDACMMLRKPTLSLKCKYFFKNGQFEGDIIFCHLKRNCRCYVVSL